MIPWLGLLLACSGEPAAEPPVAPEPDAPAPPSAVEVVHVPPPAPPSSGNPELQIQFEGVGPLYQGFFRSAEPGERLARAASSCVGDAVYLYVSFSEEEHLGRLTLRVEPDVASCRPLPTDTGWDFSPTVPLSTALAAYRDELAAAYDMRLASFEVRVAYRTDRSLCTVEARGSHPPDGTTFGACVQQDLERRCAQTGGAVALDFAERDARALRSCFLR